MIHHAHNTSHLAELDRERTENERLRRENESLRRDNVTLLLRARSLLHFNRLILDRLNGKAA